MRRFKENRYLGERPDMSDTNEKSAETPPKVLTPAAERALAEAEARRKAAAGADTPREIGGRDGPEPTRYGDWESKGILSDF